MLKFLKKWKYIIGWMWLYYTVSLLLLCVGGCACLWKADAIKHIDMSMHTYKFRKSIRIRYPWWWACTKQWNEKPMACNCLLLFRKLNHQFYCAANAELNTRKWFWVGSFEAKTRSNFTYSWERRLCFGMPPFQNIAFFTWTSFLQLR